MLIFDGFKTFAGATRFAEAATALSGLGSVVCRTQEEFDKHEVFPFQLSFPVALVDRADLTAPDEKETAVVDLVPSFGGQFAGT